jgi:hypothetical protein
MIKIMHEKPLEFSRMHEKKYFLCFWNEGLFFNVFGFFEILEKNQIFLILGMSYNISL